MSLIIAALALVSSKEVSLTRVTWYDCLDRYAQVAMFGTRTSANLAMDALAACAEERRIFQMRVFRSRAAQVNQDEPTLAATLAEEDRSAAIHVIAFTNRYRQSR